MRRRWAGGFVVIAVAAAGCARQPDEAAVRAALMAADRAFAEATARTGAQGWTSYFEEGAHQFHTRGSSIGTAAIRRTMERAFADTTRRLVWHPVSAVAAASGELGYTIGRWESQALGADARWTVAGAGSYVTIWHRQADGSWKVAVDIGNQDAAPPDSTRR